MGQPTLTLCGWRGGIYSALGKHKFTIGSPRATWLEEYQEDATWTSDPWILVCVSSQMATVHPPKDGLCGQ